MKENVTLYCLAPIDEQADMRQALEKAGAVVDDSRYPFRMIHLYSVEVQAGTVVRPAFDGCRNRFIQIRNVAIEIIDIPSLVLVQPFSIVSITYVLSPICTGGH